MKAPRVRDVAALAGVSTATVSRTMSNPELVSRATREAVRRAIEETGYTVNLAARNLRRNRTGGVLALVPNLANPFFSRILAGISEVLREEGLNLLVADTRAAPDMGALIADAADRSRCDGVIVLDGSVPAALLARRACPPVVQACEWIEGLAAPRVRSDNRTGARLAAEHLIALGHRRIAHLTGPAGNPLTGERALGYADALAAAGIAARPDLAVPGDYDFASGHRAAQRLTGRGERPTAVVCDNDEMACGLAAELRTLGLDVPGDVSVVGFDDIEFAAHVTPGLTTVHQRRTAVGTEAARRMLALLAGESGEDAATTITLPVELVVRGSTAPP